MAPKKKAAAAAATTAAPAPAVEKEEQKAQQEQNQEQEQEAKNADGPTPPSNSAAAAAEQAQINKTRLTRFTRPFVASNKKGGPAAVPQRKWREDNNKQENETEVTADGAEQQNNNKRNGPILITKSLVEELTEKLGPVDVQRALAKQDPIPVNSTEAASIRSKRFHTETPQEAADKRQSRFDAEKANDSNIPQAPQAPLVDPSVAAAREARWGTLLTTTTNNGGKNNNNKNNGNGKKVSVDAAPLSELEKKRLERFK